ncbi:MAG: PIN domain-containing protein [Rhodothermales bacterium]|nr:PIN domain-containing protein [Rhodothermales bacterium]
MTLVDTSVWIDFFKGSDLPHVARLERLIDEEDTIALCGINLTEILQGIDDDLVHRRVHSQLRELVLVPLSESTFVAAADIYRTLRRVGVTIRKTNDCIIAAAAMESGCSLLHNDRDFSVMAKLIPLEELALN